MLITIYIFLILNTTKILLLLKKIVNTRSLQQLASLIFLSGSLVLAEFMWEALNDNDFEVQIYAEEALKKIDTSDTKQGKCYEKEPSFKNIHLHLSYSEFQLMFST